MTIKKMWQKFKCSPQWNIAISSPFPAVQNLSKCGTEMLQFCREFSKCGKSAYVLPYKILQFCHCFQECNFLPKCWPKPSKYLKCMCPLMQVCNFATVSRSAIFYQNVGQNHRNTWSACAPSCKFAILPLFSALQFQQNITGKVHRKSACALPTSPQQDW